MKLSKKRLKKIIQEEVERDYILQELNKCARRQMGEKDDEDYAAKKKLGRIAEYAAMLANVLSENEEIKDWEQAKITKAKDYIQSVFDSKFPEKVLKEGNGVRVVGGPPPHSYDSEAVNYLTMPGLEDPNSPDANEDTWFTNVRSASRILEDLPLEKLPVQVTQATALLRDAIDLMITPLNK